MPSVPSVAQAPARSLWDNGITVCCPDCGSFLDAPRIDPVSRELARKCVACRVWHPVSRPRFDRDPSEPLDG
jgi:hypothetical protein